MQRNLPTSKNCNVTIESLLYSNRFPINGLKLSFLCLYFPLGCLLAILRLFIGFHTLIVACVLRKWSNVQKIILRIFCIILGVIVVETGTCQINSNNNNFIIVSNHVSILDHLAIYLIRPCVKWHPLNLSEFIKWCLNLTDLEAGQGRTALISNAKKFSEDRNNLPLLIFPEEFSTNGNVGLLKFNTWSFSLKTEVQPVFISLSRPPFANIAPTVVGTDWKFDLFWFLFVPYTIFHLRWLEKEEMKKDETEEMFAGRVQNYMAEVGSLVATPFSRHECAEYVKKIKTDQKRTQNKLDNFDGLATTVKEILPQVPLHVIRKDLERTRSVDTTVSNLLEGRTPYTPEASLSNIQLPKKPVKSLSTDPSSWKQLFEDRKRDMVYECRQKYLMKKKLI